LGVLAEKLEANIERIKDIEMDTERLFLSIQQIMPCENDEEILKFKELILARMNHTQNESQKDIQESAEGALHFISKKRKQRHLDEFLDAFLQFVQEA